MTTVLPPQCWCGYYQAEHTAGKRRESERLELPVPCESFDLWRYEP